MTTADRKSPILMQYSVNVLMHEKRASNKGNLLDNLFQYMIKTNDNQKEDLALNIDELLYGNK